VRIVGLAPGDAASRLAISGDAAPVRATTRSR
jgi:hypothetical protein